MAIALTGSGMGDTLTLAEADSMLAVHNAAVRMARLEADAATAQAEQARRWENPEVSGLYNIYNPVNQRWLDAGSEGEVDVSLSQPLPIGGQHRWRVRQAEATGRVAIAEADLTLFSQRMELRRLWAKEQASERRVALVGKELESVERIVAAYRRQNASISLVELRRLETLRLSLLAEQGERQQALAEVRMRLALMLGMEDIQVDTGALVVADTNTVDVLRSLVLVPIERRMEASEAEVRLQSAQAWPRVALTLEYDKNGNIGHNFWAAGATVTLPLWDRNRGGVRAARLEHERQHLELQQAERELQQAVALGRACVEQCRTLCAEAEQLAQWNIEPAERQYLERNISLLELLDHYAAWREAQELLADSQRRLVDAAVELNLVAGIEIIKIQ